MHLDRGQFRITGLGRRGSSLRPAMRAAACVQDVVRIETSIAPALTHECRIHDGAAPVHTAREATYERSRRRRCSKRQHAPAIRPCSRHTEALVGAQHESGETLLCIDPTRCALHGQTIDRSEPCVNAVRGRFSVPARSCVSDSGIVRRHSRIEFQEPSIARGRRGRPRHA